MFPIQTDSALRIDDHGAIRIGNTRVALEIVIGEYLAGTNAEEIAEQYSTLALADVYSAIGYYLRHREEVEAYLQRRDQLAEEVCQRIEARQAPAGELRAKLIARRAAGESDASSASG